MSTNTTVPATLVGVWPGAQAIHTDGRAGDVFRYVQRSSMCPHKGASS